MSERHESLNRLYAVDGPAETPAILAGIERVPAWERFPWLRAAFSTRLGGGSAVYGEGEQNLGWTAEDDPAIVAANRRRFIAAASEGRPMRLITLQQIHGDSIRDVDAETPPLMTDEGKATLQGDGLLSRCSGKLLGVITADCVPVLVADTRTRAVAAFHAGWRGTLAGIVARGVETLGTVYGSRPEDLVAAIGPCIGACCFAVGEEVRSGFEDKFRYAPELFSEVLDAEFCPQIHLNLQEANRRQLLDAGVPAEDLSILTECTACSRLEDGRRKYYSHRSELGLAGRMMSVIGSVPE